MARVIESTPPARIEYVRLPDPSEMPSPGETWTYDANGERVEDGRGNVIISSFGVQFVWVRFQEPVKAGQIATMVISNLVSAVVSSQGSQFITAAAVIDGAATEWEMATNQPAIGNAVVELITVERGMGVGRITCRNTHIADLYIAAGVASPIALFLPS
jgi:hypothetical protein